MRNRVAALAALGIVAYAVFLVAMVPARFVVSRLALPPELKLEAIEGSAWNGRARVTWDAGGAPFVLDDVRWRWRPAALLAGRAAFDVETQGGVSGHARVSRRFAGWMVDDLDLRGDASAIAAFVPLAAAWQPSGTVHVTAPSLAWNGRELRGHADAQVSDVSLAIAAVKPLGSYTAHVEGDGGPARVTIASTQGPLRLSGNGTLDAQGRFAFTGEARAEGPQAQVLEPVLNLLGPKRVDGSHALRMEN